MTHFMLPLIQMLHTHFLIKFQTLISARIPDALPKAHLLRHWNFGGISS